MFSNISFFHTIAEWNKLARTIQQCKTILYSENSLLMIGQSYPKLVYNYMTPLD